MRRLLGTRMLYLIYIALPALGIGCLLLGRHLDSTGYWSTRPFDTNIFSAFTGGCFGVPVALLVLERLRRASEDEIERSKARLALLQVSEILSELKRAIEPALDREQLPRHVVVWLWSRIEENSALFAERFRVVPSHWEDAHLLIALSQAQESALSQITQMMRLIDSPDFQPEQMATQAESLISALIRLEVEVLKLLIFLGSGKRFKRLHDQLLDDEMWRNLNKNPVVTSELFDDDEGERGQ